MRDEAVDFDRIIEDILYDKFYQPLPTTFAEFTKKRKAEDISKPGVNNDKYKKHFAGKNMKARPMIDGKPACHRWHTKGYCFDECRNKNTHIPSTQLSEETKVEYKNFFDLCMN